MYTLTTIHVAAHAASDRPEIVALNDSNDIFFVEMSHRREILRRIAGGHRRRVQFKVKPWLSDIRTRMPRALLARYSEEFSIDRQTGTGTSTCSTVWRAERSLFSKSCSSSLHQTNSSTSLRLQATQHTLSASSTSSCWAVCPAAKWRCELRDASLSGSACVSMPSRSRIRQSTCAVSAQTAFPVGGIIPAISSTRSPDTWAH